MCSSCFLKNIKLKSNQTKTQQQDMCSMSHGVIKQVSINIKQTCFDQTYSSMSIMMDKIVGLDNSSMAHVKLQTKRSNKTKWIAAYNRTNVQQHSCIYEAEFSARNNDRVHFSSMVHGVYQHPNKMNNSTQQHGFSKQPTHHG